MEAETTTQAYKGLFRLPELEVWMPDGKTYKAAPLIAEAKTPADISYTRTIAHMRKQVPRQRPMPSGEWSVVREALQEINSNIEESMITGAYEMTATFADYTHGKPSQDGKWFHGLLIELPEVNDDGLVAGSDGIIKARRIFESPLPVRGDFVEKLITEAPDLAIFFNAIYGKEDAVKTLPGYAYFAIGGNPTGIRNILRGCWDLHGRGTGRVNVSGGWGPSRSREDVASRGAAEGIVRQMDEDEYQGALADLRKLRSLPPSEAAALIDEIEESLLRAELVLLIG